MLKSYLLLVWISWLTQKPRRPLLCRQVSNSSDYSMATADIIDSEVRELVERAYARAKDLMTTHINILHKLAALLIEKETVDGEEFLRLFIENQAELYVA